MPVQKQKELSFSDISKIMGANRKKRITVGKLYLFYNEPYGVELNGEKLIAFRMVRKTAGWQEKRAQKFAKLIERGYKSPFPS